MISRHEHLDAVYSVTPHPNLPSVVLTASADGCVYTIDTREPYKRGESVFLHSWVSKDRQLIQF